MKNTALYYLEYWLGSHILGMSTFITGKLCNGLLSYILLILPSIRKCFWLFFRVTSLFIENIKTIQTKLQVHSLFGYLNDNFNIYSLKYVINLIFRLFFNVCAIVILQAETPFNIRFWNGSSCKQETKTTAPADVYKAWNPKGWQTLRKAQAYFSWYYASVLL